MQDYATFSIAQAVRFPGIGLALDWIAMRGQPMPAQNDNARHDEAASALVDLLADMTPEIVEPLVRGAAEGHLEELKPIPSGIWTQTAAKDSNEASGPYCLISVDDDDENEGAILGPQVSGYRRVQIRADFIANNWLETTLAIAAVKSRPAVAICKIRSTINRIRAEAPNELRPLANCEIVNLVRRLLPHASRDIVRNLVREVQPEPNRGLRSARQPGRQAASGIWPKIAGRQIAEIDIQAALLQSPHIYPGSSGHQRSQGHARLCAILDCAER
jgi:hypothetical protein